MSAQSAKKKRLGSRRLAPNQNETFKADNVADGTSVTRRHVPEESTESLNVLSDADDSKPETRHPPSPEVPVNRRKMGSSRRNKGRQHVKDSESEARLDPGEEAEENRRDTEALETTQTSLATQRERQEEMSEQDVSATQKSPLSSATTPDYCSEVKSPTTTNCPEDVMEVLMPRTENLPAEGVYKSDALQSEEIRGKAHATGLTVLSCPSVDQQTINNQPSNSRATADEGLPHVCSVAQLGSNKRSDDADSFRQGGILQGSDLLSESHVEPVVVESVTSETAAGKSSPTENTEVERSVEQALFTLAKEELPTSEEQNELFSVSEGGGAQHSEDAVDEVHEEDVQTAQMQDIHQNDYSLESLIIDAVENADTCSGNLTEQAEIREAYQSEPMEESADDSANKQEVPNPDDKRGAHPTEERHCDALDENYHVFESKQAWINDTERVDVALGPMYEGDIKHDAGQSAHQDEAGVLSEDETSKSALQTFQSDSQPQDQTNTGFGPSGNRRKLGSSRRHKGRQRVQESKEEVSGGDEQPEPTEMSLTTETLSQESNQEREPDILSVLHDSSMVSVSALGGSSDVQKPSAAHNPETDLESFRRELGDQAERETDLKVEVSDESVDAMLEGLDKSATLQGEEVTSALHSEDAVKKEPEDEVKPALRQEILPFEYTTERATDDAAERSEIVSVNSTERAELMAGSADDSATKQEVFNPDDNQDERPTKEREDYHVYDSTTPWISETDRADAAPGEGDIKPNAELTFHQEKEELLSDMDESKSAQTAQSGANSPLDSQHQDNSVSVDEHTNTGFHHSRNRRKLGSSRRNKGKQCVTESEEGNEPGESTAILLTMETAGQEKSGNTSPTEEDNTRIDTLVCTSELTAVTAHSSPTVDQQVIERSRCRQVPDEELSHVCSVTDTASKERHECTELLRQDGDLQESGPHVCPITLEVSPGKASPRGHTDPEYSGDEPIDSSPKEELPTKEEQLSDVRGAQHSEHVKRVHEQEVKPAQRKEMSQVDDTSESVIHDATETGNVTDRLDLRDQSELAVKNTDDPEKGNIFEALDQRNDDYHAYGAKKSQISDIERVSTALSGVNEIEGLVKDDVKPSAEKTGHQEKGGLVSEREESEPTLQGLQCQMSAPLDSQFQQNNPSFNPGGNRRTLGSSQEKLMETMLEGTHKSDTAHTEDISVHVKENAHFGAPAGFTEFTSLQSSPTVERQLINSREMPDEGLATVCSVTENKECDEDAELLNLHGNNLSETRLKSENIESFITPGMMTEHSRPSEHTEDERRIEQATSSPQRDGLATNEERHVHFNSSEVGGGWQSEDAVSTVHEEQINPAQIDYTSESSLQTLPSDASLDSQPRDTSQSISEDTPTGLNPAVSRRKLGSSRRIKGRHHAKDTVTETTPKLKDEVEENTGGDATPKTTDVSLVTETTGQEEDLRSGETVTKIRSTVSEDENTETLLEEDTRVLDNGTVVSTDITSSSDKYGFLKSNKDAAESLSELTGCDTVKMDLIQSPQASVWKDDSDMQNVSYHDDVGSSRLRTVRVLEQQETAQVQNTEALSCDEDSPGREVHALQTNDVKQTVEDVKIEDCDTEGQSSKDRQGPGQHEEGGGCDDPANKEVNASRELVCSAQEPAVDVSDESGVSTAMDARNSENLQVNKQKRRKLGSTRRSQLNRKQEGDTDDTKESDFNTEADEKSLDEIGAVEESPVTAAVSHFNNAPPVLGAVHKEQQEGNEATTVHDEGLTLQTDLLCNESNVTPGTDDLMVPLPEQCAPHNEEAVDPVTFVKVADMKDGERDSVSVEPSQIEDFTGTEMQMNSEADTNSGIADGSLVSVCEATQQNDEDRPESVKVKQDQDSDEGAHSQNLEMKNTRRRKMGSTRRNLGSRTKGEDLHQKQEVEDEVEDEVEGEATEAETAVRDVTTESVPEIPEKELPLHTEHEDGDSDPTQDKVSETVEYSHVGESQLKPPAQHTAEENPASRSQPVETEHQLTPPSTSPKNDTSASGRRRRKLGSHRKSRGPQTYEDQSVKEGRTMDVCSLTEEGATEEHSEESLGLATISEESDKKPSSIISSPKAGEPSRPESEKPPVQPRHAEIRLGQDSQKPLSLAGNPRGPGLTSNGYNVVMVGDSSVGKTSFMKRAQSGKFSLDLSASIGLDSCMWTVVVEGKPVVLQLWDTAGQERFRSLTRQVFYKAQAFLLMYDISSSQSFSAVSYWASSIQEAAAENVPVLLLGNKRDQVQRQVEAQQGEILAKEYNFEFMECSAATGENVIESLETVARMLSQRSDTREEATVLHTEPKQKKGSRCC